MRPMRTLIAGACRRGRLRLGTAALGGAIAGGGGVHRRARLDRRRRGRAHGRHHHRQLPASPTASRRRHHGSRPAAPRPRRRPHAPRAVRSARSTSTALVGWCPARGRGAASTADRRPGTRGRWRRRVDHALDDARPPAPAPDVCGRIGSTVPPRRASAAAPTSGSTTTASVVSLHRRAPTRTRRRATSAGRSPASTAPASRASRYVTPHRPRASPGTPAAASG